MDGSNDGYCADAGNADDALGARNPLALQAGLASNPQASSGPDTFLKPA